MPASSEPCQTCEHNRSRHDKVWRDVLTYGTSKLYKQASCEDCRNAGSDSSEHSFRSFNPMRCAACYKLRDGISHPFFLCRDCLGRLPDDLRRAVLSAGDWLAEPRVACLKFLGAKNTNDVRCGRPPRDSRRMLCKCQKQKRRAAVQVGMLGMPDTEVCSFCTLPLR